MRIDAIDIARGYTVLIMPMVHVFVVFGNTDTLHSLAAIVMSIFAEETGAPLFMFLMGLSAGLNRDISPRILFKRSLVLMALAFVLNFLKFVLPFLPGLFPVSLLIDLGISDTGTAVIELLLIGDILHLASLSFFVFGISSLFRRYQWMFEFLVLLALLICVSYAWSIEDSFGIAAWIAGELPDAYFPLLPWLFYPLAGKLVSFVLIKFTRPFWIYSLAGVVLLCISSFHFLPHENLYNYYKPGVAGLLYYTGCILIWLMVCDCFSKVKLFHGLKENLRFLSRHITMVYFIQWLLIMWSVALIGYRQQGLWSTLLIALLITTATMLGTKLCEKIVTKII
ncbi:heparan-alpha-glucosaminide N-acetyltransferase domain-containing protein [Lacibacter sp.]|uniref:heparan-alpha-glucosaminide N-acetyltransferase domain-containing protein n=1 Tax=Lacibacter sp. TaxID=1915409 RepID=UPI002B4B5D83|nr:heparan-alpha-glucosaminide N-acetyltransferase domain-containing protein [Lacibacter sp.]HLP37719.1 heparan-alpha-glucosaminide N-acetyltransferase domain-containing protein [Lacibacter sp.]